MIFFIIGVLIVLLITVIIGISYFFAKAITLPKVPTMEESRIKETGRNGWKEYDRYPKKNVEMISFDGYILHGEVWERPGKKYVVVTHGYTSTRFGSVKYAHIYYALGYNVVIYDLRYHGENQGGYCSMGYLESRDVLSVIQWVRDTYGNDCIIGLHGESLGSASTIQALGVEQNLLFAVSDCGFSDLKELMQYQAHARYHLPEFLAKTISWINYLIHGYQFYDICPKKALENNQVPVLFIHGEKDDFIPPSMCRDMYEMTKSKKKMILFPNAVHAESYLSDPDTYEKCVAEFVKEIETQEFQT